MKNGSVSLLLAVGLLVLLPALAACDGNQSSTNPTPVPFSIEVIPVHMEDTIAGQSFVFMVTVTDEETKDNETKPVNISATAPDAKVTVGPQAIAAGYVAEVVVVPEEASTGNTITVTIEGERDGLKKTEIATLIVQAAPPAIKELAAYAAELRDKFIPWLAENYPDLNITSETKWAGTVVYPNTPDIMGYYLLFSEKWEMGIRWHVTTESDDWVRIYLRLRTAELTPSKAFEISSVRAQEEHHPIEPPKEVWR